MLDNLFGHKVTRMSLFETRYHLWGLAGFLVLISLYLSSLYSYLLFHVLVEFFSVIVACVVFVIAWNTRKLADNGFFIFIGIAYLFVAGIDFVHTLAFSGMNVINDVDGNMPTQFWIAARYLQSISILLAPIFLKKKINAPKYLIIFGVIFILLIIAVFKGVFPDAYIQEVGLTSFKIISEYVISTILMIAGVIYVKKGKYFSGKVLSMLLWSIILTVLAEMSFMLYIDVSGFFNLLGHYLKLVSFFLIYKSMVVVGVAEPQKMIYKQLKESEKKYKDLFEYMSDGFALHKIITKDGKPVDYEFLEINYAFEKLMGISEFRAVGKKATEIISGIKNDPVDWINRYGEVALYGRNISFEHKSESLNKWFYVTAYSPSYGYFATVFEDITERKIFEDKIRESQEKYKTLVEASPDSIMLLDSLKKPLFINNTGRKQFNLKNEENLEDWDYLSCVEEKDREDYVIALDLALRGETSTIEIRRINENLETKIYREIIVPVKKRKGNGLRVFTISRDITKEKEIDCAKTEFISLAAHQLKTPLTSAGFAVEILNKKYAGDQDAEELLNDLSEDIKFMTEIINRLLSVSRIEMGTFVEEPVRVNLSTCLVGMIDNMSLVLKKKQQIFKKDFAENLPEDIIVDANILKNVLQNLINNASRHTPEKSIITFSVKRNNSDLIIGVSDTGSGIPKDIQPKIFTKMYKAFESLKTENDSSGLGLYIAKLFIERIGGKIWFETKETGTTFFISLPIK